MTTQRGERFQLLSRLFDEIVDAPDDMRDSLIRYACEGDAGLESELRELLQADTAGESHAYVSGVIAAEAATIPAPSLTGHRLGAWAIEKPIGEGGMGTVYRARRADGEYEATAAIKLVRGGVPSPMLAERMRSERQILAGLSHPGVAQLLDGGSTDDGTPYLVMEFVDGKSITEWCEERDLDIEGRLRLFAKVCDAVSYAHGALVAHRDLKPSNILVTSDGEPKLLDFGIAKLVDSMGDEQVTQSYAALTPAYASPEQVVGERAGVAADIYSLGVLLYELLSGKLPLQTRGLTPVQVISKVTTEVPPVLSSVTEDPAQRRKVRGDLDAIVSQALRKEPYRRYGSVGALAEDVRLHLDGLPIKARRDDWTYRTGKLVRRNAGVVSGGVLLLILMITFTINAVLQARAVARERDRTEAERQTAVRVSEFLEELLTEADPNEATTRDITAREVLDRGAERVLSGLEEDPDIQAALATVMGRVYRRLGEYEAAEPLLDSALAVVRNDGSADADRLGEVLIERAALGYDEGDYQLAYDMAQEALSVYGAVASGDDARIASALDWSGQSLMALGRMDEAERDARRVVDIYRSIDPDPNQDLSTALTAYGDVLRGMGSFDQALEVGREALAMARQVYGDQHLEVAFSLNQLTSTLRAAGRAEEAVPLVEEGLAIRRAAFPGPHVETAASLGNLANTYAAVGRMDEAEQARRESHDMLLSIFDEPHPYTAAATNSLGGLLAQRGKYAEAEPLLVESLRLHRTVFPPGHPNIAIPLVALGHMYLDQGRLTEAERALREAYELRSAALPPGHFQTAESALRLGLALDRMGHADEARPLLEESHASFLAVFGPDDRRTAEAKAALDAPRGGTG
jgi:serine/threonine-protein kinase